ncbi:uncharacterized protein LOC124896652 [Capsicum annuum]|uniref:uncharacterized protein LOC124896652 n=1 Tax=Capsicum annuum TaxID=4072 RepID=UPI001FB0E39B|nr:uncharacterized protein LOC124896652 [Capsicum annuum]
MDSENNFSQISPPVFDGENYHIWKVRMEIYLEALDLWEAMEEDYDVLPLSDNPTMKESETVKKYSDRLLGIVNKAQEQRRLIRQDGMVEVALAANHKTQSKGNNSRKNYPSCQDFGKIGHPPFKCWKRPDAQCKICNQLGHEAVICKNKSQKYEADAQVTKEEEEDHLFKIRIGNGDYISAEGQGNIAIKTISGIKIISNVHYVPDIDKSLLSIGELMEEGFKLLFGDNYCRIFDSTDLEILQIDMRGKSFLFNPIEDAHKSCKNKAELADLFNRSNSAQAETISDPRRKEVELVVREEVVIDSDGDDDDSDQSIDYRSDVHEDLMIVEKNVRKFKRRNRRNKKKEKPKDFLGEVGLNDGYDDIDKGNKNYKDKLTEDKP